MPQKKHKSRQVVLRSVVCMILSVLAFLSPVLMGNDSSKTNVPFRDYLGRLAICDGITDNVSIDDAYTDEECRKLHAQAIAASTIAALQTTPALSSNTNALLATQFFIRTDGLDIYRHSPMATHFENHEWLSGCLAFRTFNLYGVYKKDIPWYECHPLPDGKFKCKIIEVVKIRNKQEQICLGEKTTAL